MSVADNNKIGAYLTQVGWLVQAQKYVEVLGKINIIQSLRWSSSIHKYVRINSLETSNV